MDLENIKYFESNPKMSVGTDIALNTFIDTRRIYVIEQEQNVRIVYFVGYNGTNFLMIDKLGNLYIKMDRIIL